MSAGIYKLTSPSGKVYIGQTVQLNARLNKYKNGHIKNQSYIYNAIKKYDFDNFIVEILYETKKKYNHLNIMLDVLEKKFIKFYKSNNPEFGYNLMSGGTNGYRHSEETKRKISVKRKEYLSIDENIEKLKQSMVGRKKPEYTKERSKKISEALTKRFIIIEQYTLDGIYLRDWNGATEVEKELNIKKSNICKVLKGERKTTGGYIWKYKKNKQIKLPEGEVK